MSDVPPPTEQDQGQMPDPQGPATQEELGGSSFLEQIGKGISDFIQPRSDVSVVNDLDYSTRLRNDTDAAIARGDEQEASDLLYQQRAEAFRALVEVEIEGGDPLSQTTPRAAFVDPQVETQRRLIAAYRQDQEIDEVFKAEGVEIAEGFWDDIQTQFHEINEAKAIEWKPDQMSDEEKEAFRRQLQPAQVDPNKLGDIRQILVKADQRLKKISPKLSVYDHPRTRDMAIWLNREVGGATGAGYMVAKDQPYEYQAGLEMPLVPDWMESTIGFTAQQFYKGWTGMVGAVSGFIRPIDAMGNSAIGNLTGSDGSPYFTPPDKVAELPQRLLSLLPWVGPKSAQRDTVHNGSKVHPDVTLALQIKKKAAMSELDEWAHRVGKANEWKTAQENGFESLLGGVIATIGSVGTFTATTGKIWEAGSKLAMKGMQLTVGAKRFSTLTKAQAVITRTSGATVAGGLVDAANYGDHEGYAKAYASGATMVPFYLLVGATGRWTEKGLRGRKNMPNKVAAKVGGLVDGMGLSVLEITDMAPLWNFRQDPNESTWGEWAQIMLKNMLAMAVMKKGRPSQTAGDVFGVSELRGAIGETSKRAYEAKDPAERERILKEGEAEGWSREDMLELGRVKSEEGQARGVAPERAKEAREEVEQKTTDAQRVREGLEEPDARRAEKEFEEGKPIGEGGARERRAQKEMESQEKELTQKMREEAKTPEERQMVKDRLKEEARIAELRKTAEETGDVVGRPPTAAEHAKELRRLMEADEAEAAMAPKKTKETSEAEDLAAVQRLRDQGFGEDVAKVLALRQKKDREAGEGGPIGKLGARRQRGEARGRIREALPSEAKRLEARPQEGARSTQEIDPSGGKEAFEAVEGVETIKKSELKTLLKGRPARKGVLGVGKREGDPIQVTMRKKGFRGEGIEGYIEGREDLRGQYDPAEHLIRTKEAIELNTDAHEWAHAMQRETVGFDWKPKTEKAEAELMALAEPMSPPNLNKKQRRAEGWAEFFARDILGDPKLKEQSPELYREMMEWMVNGDPALLKQYHRIKDGFYRWMAQGAVERAIGEIEGGPGTKKTGIEKEQEEGAVERLEKFIGKLTDEAHLFQTAYKKYMDLAGKDPSELDIAYRPGDLYASLKMTAPKIADGLLRGGMTDTKGNPIEGIESIETSVGRLTAEEYKPFWAFMKRSKELEMMKKGLETGVSKEEALRVVERLETPKFKEIAEDINKWFHGLIDYVAEAGGMSMEEAERIKSAYAAYIPFHRMGDMHAQRRRGAGEGIAEKGTGLKRMKGGGTEPVLDPRVAIQQMTTALVVRAQKAMVTRSLFSHMLLNEGQGGFVTDVTRDVIGRDVAMKDIVGALQEMEIKGDAKHRLEGAVDIVSEIAEGNFDNITVFTQATTPRKGTVIAHSVHYNESQMRDIVRTKKERLQREGLSGVELTKEMQRFEKRLNDMNGTLRWLELDPDAYALMMGVEAGPTWIDGLPAVMQAVIKIPARSVRLGATELNPFFHLRNMARDVQQHALYSKYAGPFPILSGLGAFYKGFKTPKEGKELMDRLGGGSFGLTAHELAMDKAGAFGEQPGWTRKMIMRPVEALAEFMGRSEQFLRRTEFQKTREEILSKAKTPQERLDREFSANMQALLNAKEVTVNFTRGTSFIRAVNQAFPYFGAGIQGNRKFVRAMYGSEGKAAQTQAIVNGLTNLSALTALNYFWHGQEDWYRDRPQWHRMNYWSFKLFDDVVMNVPKPFEAGQFFTAPVEWLLDQLYDADQKMEAKNIAWEMAKGFMNNHQILPSLMLVPMEHVTNFNLFRGRQIVPEWMLRSKKNKDQYDKYTSQTAKWLGEVSGMSPKKIENAIGGWTGGAGISLMRAIDGFKRQGSIPGSSIFGQKHRWSRYVSDFYEIKREIAKEGVTSRDKSFRGRFKQAQKSLKAIETAVDAGRIDTAVANKRQFEIAKRVVEAYRRTSR